MDIFFYVSIILSLHYATYIASFDIKSFLFIDSNAIIEYFFRASILYILIYGLLIIAVKFLTNYLPLAASNIWENASSEFFNNKITIFVLQILLFSYYYVGKEYFWIPFFGVFLIIFIYFWNAIKKSEGWVEDYETDFKIIFMNIYLKFKNYKQNKEFLIEIVLTTLLFLSILLGSTRAAYVKDNFIVTIGDDKAKYVLFSSTKTGAMLYRNDKVVFFPWENISYLNFVDTENEK